ncbi:DUF4389 domain-containing protein [Litoribrevibacter albus]|uniref:Lipase n=1 Tax=Litoribrevibacter albus TaxID=1473156 RepID=A0AA37W6L3_9GAMM|nr:DUF4389 domain-containing protein [Litoribrevibacter albus]GLQ30074.1 lipase [Litoribrevibacter albus]
MNYDDQAKLENKLLRLAFMVLFAVIYRLLDVVLLLLVIAQYLFHLLTDKDNETLRQLGDGISCYYYQIFQYLTYNTEEKPFPFSDWPTTSEEMVKELGRTKSE